MKRRLKNTSRGNHATIARDKQLAAPQLARREMLGVLGAASAALVMGCSESPTSSSGGSSSGACAVTPSETAGPFPSLTDLVRSDIRDGRTGVQLTLTLKVVNVSNGCTAVSGANVEIWHCDVSGNYSQYGTQVGQTFLRGIQTTNSTGEVTFTTIYPGWYQGRATHIHAEVTVNNVVVKVSQMACPEAIYSAVYTSANYASRGLNPTPNSADGILADSLADELVTVSGSPAAGYTASWQIGI